MPLLSTARVPLRFLAWFVAGLVVFAAVSAVILTLPKSSQGGTVLLPAGTLVPLQPSGDGYAAGYPFSWGWGAYLEGRWTSTAQVTVVVAPRLDCTRCPLMMIYEASGTSGVFNLTFGGVGWQYPNMTLAFQASGPATIRVSHAVQVVYPPMTVLYPAGTVLSGTSLQFRPFDVQAPGAFLVGAWSAVNTTVLPYDGTPQEPASCAGWPTYAAPTASSGTFHDYLMPGPHAVGVAPCSTQPWTVIVSVTIGFFYP